MPFVRTLTPEDKAVFESDTQSRHGDLVLLAGNVEIKYHGRTLRADSVTYNVATGQMTADGHVHVTSDENDESLTATHGSYNLKTGLGRFYEVSGSVGMRGGASTAGSTPTAFLFKGKMVVKSAPTRYDVYDGWVTSCELPKPDWELSSHHIWMDGERAAASNTTFRLINVPVLFLPYVTHPTDMTARQSGLLVPVISQSSTKGIVIGEGAYIVLGRSADLTAGFEYFSSRGFSEFGTFRYKGRGMDFASAHFSALQDRGYYDNYNHYINQGGEDVTAAFRRDFNAKWRGVGEAEYLSSYIYREAFNNNFNQAVSSDITSLMYLSRTSNGYVADARFERYQGLKRVSYINTAGVTIPGEEVRIFHAPQFEFNSIDHHIANTPLLWKVNSSFGGLKRIQPNFTDHGVVQRFDLSGELAAPFHAEGWNGTASVIARETVYSHSRKSPYGAAATPVELNDPVNRASLEMKVDLRPPAIERTFEVPEKLQKFFGTEMRHTVEPEIQYRNVRGIDNFLSILRFDDVDLAANTDELEYGLTQHLYFRPRPKKDAKPVSPECEAEQEKLDAEGTPSAFADAAGDSFLPTNDGNGIASADDTAAAPPLRSHHGHNNCAVQKPQQQEWFSWKLAQKHFFDPTFGGAVINSRRNVFDSTLSLSGIAFLTEARDISPLISRMRLRTSSHTDIAWDFDLDPGAKRFTSSNVYIDAHEGQWFGGLSFADLNAPGRFYSIQINSTNNTGTLTSSANSTFAQMRVLGGYGTPTKPGFSAAANAGLDLRLDSLQYGSLQTNYNWNCCGVSVEYRKYELGSTRNEGVFRFSFTLINIGTAGNLRRQERIF